jgi:hypothetical protein
LERKITDKLYDFGGPIWTGISLGGSILTGFLPGLPGSFGGPASFFLILGGGGPSLGLNTFFS